MCGLDYTETDCHFSSVNMDMASKADSGTPRPDSRKSSIVCTTIASSEQFHYDPRTGATTLGLVILSEPLVVLNKIMRLLLHV